MELVQSRIVTDDVVRLAGFYARLLGVPITLNDYYVEVQAGAGLGGLLQAAVYRIPDQTAGRHPRGVAAGTEDKVST